MLDVPPVGGVNCKSRNIPVLLWAHKRAFNIEFYSRLMRALSKETEVSPNRTNDDDSGLDSLQDNGEQILRRVVHR